jgi:hypothetical protein
VGSYNDPNITTYDSTPSSVNTLQNQAMQYLQNFMQNPQSWAQQFQNPAAQQAQAWMMANAGNNPEAGAYGAAAPFLQSMGQRPDMAFSNEFRELQNPYGDVGAMNPVFGALAAASPIFDRNMQSTLAKVNAAAPGRFSSALAQEGRDVGTQAMQDFNLFAQQALSQGIGQQIQQQQANQNFMLGARGLQQGAVDNTNRANLSGRDLAQQNDNNRANAFSILGQLASNAGNGAFNRQLQSGTFGLQSQQAMMNPIMQMLAGIMGWAQPQPGTPIVGQSPLQTAMGIGQMGLTAWDIWNHRNRGGGQPGSNPFPYGAPGSPVPGQRY